jgi:hypothetical protein
MSIDVCWGAALLQPVVLEMLEHHGLPTAQETPFSLTEAHGDNADGLVSPYRATRERILVRLNYILDWLEVERAGEGAELWLTEGYDDAFTELKGSKEKLYQAVQKALALSADAPSLRLKLG